MLPLMEIILPSSAAGSSNVPAFLAKLWKMVDDPGTNHLISWSDEGTSFIIHNQAEFAQSLLPYYYKHSNMASFVRQLNMYGFHKVVGIESGGLKSEKQEEMEFAHAYFIRGMEILLDKIKRKVSANKSANYAPAMKTERVNEVLNEVSIIRDRQEDLDSKLDTMKKENEALWREVVNLRQKHQAQQKIVNKLIHFLVSMVQPRMGPAVKRRYPNQLAIEDTYGEKNLKLDMAAAADGASGEAGGGAGTSRGFDLGPIISEVIQDNPAGSSGDGRGDQIILGGGGDLDQVLINIEMPETPEAMDPSFFSANNSAAAAGGSVNVAFRPTTPVSAAMRAVDPSLLNPSIMTATSASPQSRMTLASTAATKSPITTVVTPKRPAFKREISKEDFDLETNILQKDLDNLKDILSGQITFDSNFLTSLFNPEEPMPNLVFPAGSQAAAAASSSGAGGASPSYLTSPGQQLQLELDNGLNFELSDMDEVSPRESAANSSSRSDEEPFNVSSLNTPLPFADEVDPMVAHMKRK